MSRKAKDYILLFIVLILVAGMFAIVIYDAVMANKKEDTLEIYIDTTPLNYTDNDKAAYAFKFSQSVTSITKKIGINSNDATLHELISKVLDAMAKARIPAEKLGKIGDAITNSSQDIIDFFTRSGDINEDDIEDIMATAKIQLIAEFSNNFFNTTTLTEEEFSSILYQYMLANASTPYKQAMYKLGKKDYITFISNTLYLLNTLGEIGKEGKNVQSNILQSVIYELGSNYIEILDKVGLDAIQTVLGFGWHYQGDNAKVELLNTYADSLTNKLGYLFGIAGYAMKALTAKDIDNLTYFLSLKEGREKDDYLIYMQSILSKAVFVGMLNSLKYLNGETSIDTLIPELKQMIVDSYRLRITLSNEEESAEMIANYQNSFDKFAQSLIFFSTKTLTLEEIAAMSEDEYYLALKENAKNINGFNLTLDDFIFNVIFVWANNLFTGAKLEG